MVLWVKRKSFAPEGVRKPNPPASSRVAAPVPIEFNYRKWMYMYIHTYLLTPWCRVLLEKLTGLQLVKKFPALHGTRRFITVLTSLRHLSLSWASPIQSIYPHPTSWRSILILSTFACCAMFPLETLPPPPGDPGGGVIYPRIVLSPEQASGM